MPTDRFELIYLDQYKFQLCCSSFSCHLARKINQICLDICLLNMLENIQQVTTCRNKS